jgi:hypothetical protein
MVAASALCIPVGECSIESMLVARGEGVSESRDLPKLGLKPDVASIME